MSLAAKYEILLPCCRSGCHKRRSDKGGLAMRAGRIAPRSTMPRRCDL